jgi:leader peptidase (prepilin peptidase)/N-methyltransferase
VIAICVLAALAPVLSMVDVAERRLPNMLTVGSYPVLAVVLAIAAAFTDDWPALLRAVVGFIALPAFYLSIAASHAEGSVPVTSSSRPPPASCSATAASLRSRSAR